MRSRSHLLALPIALAATHMLLSTLGVVGSDGVAQWSPQVVQTLVCVGLPLALIAGTVALANGFRGRPATVRLSAIVVPQLVGFLALDAVEHGISQTFSMRVACGRSFWIALSAHTAVALATWLVLRLSQRVGRELARSATRTEVSSAPQVRLIARFTASAAVSVPVGSLSRRGPPAHSLLFS